MISKTTINQRIKQKTNSVLVDTIFLAKKSNPEIAAAIAVPARNLAKVNIERLNNVKSEVVIIPGKVLSSGEIRNKKLKIYALGFSESAMEKLKKAGCECKTILEALKAHKNEKIKGEIVR